MKEPKLRLMAERVRKRRKSAGLTQEQAAVSSGMSTQQQWAKIEKSDTDARIGTIGDIARTLRCDPADLYAAVPVRAGNGRRRETRPKKGGK